MNKNVHDFVELIERNKGVNTKEEMISIVTQTIAMVRDGRAVFHTNFFTVVFCYSKNSSFSNVVLSLSKLTPIRDKIAISCMLREIHEFSSHAIRHGLYIKNRKRLFCP